MRGVPLASSGLSHFDFQNFACVRLVSSGLCHLIFKVLHEGDSFGFIWIMSFLFSKFCVRGSGLCDLNYQSCALEGFRFRHLNHFILIFKVLREEASLGIIWVMSC